MSCDFDKLKDICDSQGFIDAVKYIKSILWKIWIANYHRDEAIQKSRPIINQPANLTNPQNDPRWVLAQYEVEAQTIAAAQAMHSMADISAQIINVCLNLGLTENRVSAYNVKQQLNGQSNYNSIYTALEDILNCNAFKYLEAFVNTTKHRRLLDIGFNIDISAAEDTVEEGIRFQSFNYDRSGHITTYLQTYAHTIYGQYLNEMIEKICALVDKLVEVLDEESS